MPFTKFELFVALRYLRAGRKQAVISVVTLISMVGVTAGVMTLNIALALNAGFRGEFQDRILGATSHVNVLKAGSGPISEYQSLADQISEMPEVLALIPTIYGQAILVSDVREQPVMLKGIDLGRAEQSSDLFPTIIEGSLDSFDQVSSIPTVVVGTDLAQSLGVAVGEDVRAMGLQGELSRWVGCRASRPLRSLPFLSRVFGNMMPTGSSFPLRPLNTFLDSLPTQPQLSSCESTT